MYIYIYIYIWIDCHNSPPKVRPFGDDLSVLTIPPAPTPAVLEDFTWEGGLVRVGRVLHASSYSYGH